MAKSPRKGGIAHELSADDPTVELDILEQTISMEGPGILRHDAHGLAPAPIPRAWIVEGNPVARNRHLAGSTDQRACAFMWDCTAGRFNWVYDDDEVIHVLEGSAIVEDASGERRQLQVGDTLLFPAGSTYQWTVPKYIRQLAFSHVPLPPEMRLATGILKGLTAPFRRK